MRSIRKCIAAFAALMFITAGSAFAQNEAAWQKAFEDARVVARRGPQDVELIDQAVLKLPAGHVFVPQPQAMALLNAMGNPGQDDRLHGIVFPEGKGHWGEGSPAARPSPASATPKRENRGGEQQQQGSFHGVLRPAAATGPSACQG